VLFSPSRPHHEQIRAIEEEAIFGWISRPRPGKPPGGQDNQDKLANERLLVILTEEQVPPLESDDGRVDEVSDRPVRLARGQDAALNRLAPVPEGNVRVADRLIVRAGNQKIARVQLR
jgi:hypothetical protein